MDINAKTYKKGINVRQLIRLPLLPPSVREGLVNSLDISSAVRDNLRDLLAVDVYDRTVPDNRDVEKEYMETVDGIRDAEWLMMRRHAKLLSWKEMLYGILPRTPKMLDKDVPENLAKEYNLLMMRSFLPYLQRDKAGSLFEPCSDKPCEHLMAMREPTEKLAKPKRRRKSVQEEDVVSAVIGYVSEDLKRKKTPLQVQPEEVVFENYEPVRTYVVKVKLQNAGDHCAMLKFILPKDPSFEVNWTRKHNILAPGLSIYLTVSFHCKDKDNRFDRLLVQPGGGSTVVIPIIAQQEPPCLYSVTQIPMSRTDKLLKTTIDCGKCLVGNLGVVRSPIYNSGSTARFFILSEMSWYFRTVIDTTEENVLIQEPFYIQPAHFLLKANKKRRLKVVFSPQWEGTHLIQVFILCDNVTLRSLDIIGEAIMYSPELFVIEGLDKCYNIFIDEDITAKYYIHLGRLLSYGNVKKTFYITNLSIVETKFRWEISKADISGIGFLTEENGSVTPSSGSLCPEQQMTFTISYNSYDMPVGKYVAIFSVYLEGIPKAALKGKQRELAPESSSELTVTICLGRIEVWLDIEPPNVCLWPNYLYFCNEPDVWNIQKLYFTNYENEWIMIWWRIPCLENLFVFPKTSAVPPFSSTIILVILKTELIGKFVALLSSHFQQSTCTFDVLLECETVINLKSGLCETKDFGILRRGEVKSGNLYASCYTKQEIETEVSHITLRYMEEDGKFMLYNPSPWLNQLPVVLKPGTPAHLVVMARTDEDQICVDVIEWKFCGLRAYTTILSDVQDLCVSLYPPILTIHDPLFKGNRMEFPITIRNHKKLVTAFQWEGYFGQGMESILVRASPERGIILPASEVEICLILEPQAACFFQDLFYFISVENMEKPLFGSICGLVKDSEVEISWSNNGRDVISVWPEEECKPRQHQYPSLETLVSEDPLLDEDCDICYSEQFTPNSTSKSFTSSEKTEANIIAYQDSDASSIPYLNWPYIGGKYYGATFADEELRKDFEAPWTEQSLSERLKGIPHQKRDAFLTRYSEKAMVFTVETFQVYSQSFNITNLSPIPVQYRVKTNRFRTERQLPPLDPFYLGKLIFHDQGLGYNDVLPEFEKLKWTRRVRKDLGLAIRISEKKGVIKPNDVQKVTVQVFAVVWGNYFDDIVICIDLHPPFHLPVLVNCDSLPVSFTFAPESKTPLLRYYLFQSRFPCIRHQRTRYKIVYLENKCFFPLKIAWSTYVIPEEEESKQDFCLPHDPPPDFSISLELHPNEDSDFCKLKLLDYIGLQESTSYIIDPPIAHLPPKSKVPVKFTVDSRKCLYNENHPTTKLTATAFGVMYIDDVNWKNEDYFCCYRPDGYDMMPVKLQLETLVELLSFRVINCSKQDVIFRVNTSRIFSGDDRKHIMTRTYCIQNFGNSPARITVEVEKPFQISAIRHDYSDEPDLCSQFEVKSFECIEVEILLVLNRSILTRRNEGRGSFLDMENPIISELNFGRRRDVENIINLEIHILKPVFEFPSGKVIFGSICLKETKIKDIDVYVRHGDQPFRVQILRNEENIFSVTPSRGLMKEGKPTHLVLTFTPKKCKRYINIIEFISSTPGSIFPLYVEGTGSLDHKFYA